MPGEAHESMTSAPFPFLTICGLDELGDHRARDVTHVLSILDPEYPVPDDFGAYDSHQRTTLYFHDVIEPNGRTVLPGRDHVEAILDFGRALAADTAGQHGAHLLVHCHQGISRSTAAAAMLIAQADSGLDEASIFAQLLSVRRQAWPNSLMIAFADELLGRDGRLSAALAGLYAKQLGKQPEIEFFMREHGRGPEVDMALLADKGWYRQQHRPFANA